MAAFTTIERRSRLTSRPSRLPIATADVFVERRPLTEPLPHNLDNWVGDESSGVLFSSIDETFGYRQFREILHRRLEVVDVANMTESQFEVHLEDLRKGPKTVSVRALRVAMQHQGPFEELAPSPFAKPVPNDFLV